MIEQCSVGGVFVFPDVHFRRCKHFEIGGDKKSKSVVY